MDRLVNKPTKKQIKFKQLCFTGEYMYTGEYPEAQTI